jgi:DNA-directed RNA polymerase, mitochondrial
MDEDSRRAHGRLRQEDLATTPDILQPDAATPETVFGPHWPDDPDLQRQYALELESWLDGMNRYRAAVSKAGQAEEAGHFSPLRKLIAHWVEPMVALIEQYRARYFTAKSGRAGGAPPIWLKRTAYLDADALARTALETIVNRIALGKPMPQPALAAAIGQAVELIHLVGIWEAKNPALLKGYYERLQKAGATRDHRHTVLRHGFVAKVVDAAGTDLDGALWTVQQRTEIGLALIQLASTATGGRIGFDAESGRRRPTGKRGRVRSDQKLVTLNAETREWITSALSNGELRTTSRRPMLVPPKPWQGPDDGGYYLSIGTATGIVIGGHRSAAAVRKSLAAQPETAALVYRALNKLGQTRWRINRAVLEVATTARDTRVSLPGLPQPPERIEPRRPADIDTNAAARRAWRQAKARHIEAHLADVGRVLQAHIALNEAEAFADEQAIYFPHHCDFRGRIYPMPTALNIQGNDLARSLLEFADGQPIDSDEAEGWLAAHTAKMFGQGRQSFADRIAWTHAHEQLLRRIAEDPLGNRQEWEASADELWLGLAAAKEWIVYRDHGPGFVTHLPCFIDGTCNGLQHFSALAGDPELAALVNVVPSDTPQDIYQAVADRASAIVARKADYRERWALRWSGLLNGQVPRSLAKNIVMTKTYGATHKSLMDDVGEVIERMDRQGFVFALDERPKARAWMAKVMKGAMSDRLGSAEGIMQWLRRTAAIAARHPVEIDGRAKGLHWTVPTGWPWVMAYGRKQKRNAHVRVDGARPTALVYSESGRDLDAAAQMDAIAPNVIHALDAAALVFALDAMKEISAVGVIHDCVGGRAHEMSAISRAVRHGFVQLYEKHDPLQAIQCAATAQTHSDHRDRLTARPPRRDLDIARVRQSTYFFS